MEDVLESIRLNEHFPPQVEFDPGGYLSSRNLSKIGFPFALTKKRSVACMYDS